MSPQPVLRSRITENRTVPLDNTSAVAQTAAGRGLAIHRHRREGAGDGDGERDEAAEPDQEPFESTHHRTSDG